MPIPVQCSKCSAKLSAPDAAAGKKLKCPKCGSPITVPAPAAPAFEVVDDPAPAPTKKAAQAEVESAPVPAKKAARAEVDEDERTDERPKRKRSDEDAEEEDAKPRKKRRDEEEDEDEPRKKRSKDEDNEEEDDRPRKKKRSEEEAEDNDRPRKKKGDESEDEEDDRPKKKKRRKDEDESDGSKKKWWFIGAGAGLLLVAGIVVAVVLSQSDSSDSTDGGKDGGKDGTQAQVEVKVISPRTRFKAEFGNKDAYKNEVRELVITPDGSRVALTNGAYDQTQVWDTRGEAKRLHAFKGQIRGLSEDGTVLLTEVSFTEKRMELDTGAPTERPFVGTIAPHHNLSGALYTATERFSWGRSGDWRQARPFRIFHYEQPSGKSLPNLTGGEDDRVDLAAPVKQNKELVFGLPRDNKIRVFDFAQKVVVREFALSNPREYKGPAGSGVTWSAFAVSSDGKWISAKRSYLAREPDPVEIFDATGNLAVALPARSVQEFSVAFLRGRDVFVAPALTTKGTILQSNDLAAFGITQKGFIAAFRGHEKGITRVALSADGKVMATGDGNGDVCIWDLTQLP
jgi:WD40 repeat protein